MSKKSKKVKTNKLHKDDKVKSKYIVILIISIFLIVFSIIMFFSSLKLIKVKDDLEKLITEKPKKVVTSGMNVLLNSLDIHHDEQTTESEKLKSIVNKISELPESKIRQLWTKLTEYSKSDQFRKVFEDVFKVVRKTLDTQIEEIIKRTKGGIMKIRENLPKFLGGTSPPMTKEFVIAFLKETKLEVEDEQVLKSFNVNKQEEDDIKLFMKSVRNCKYGPIGVINPDRQKNSHIRKSAFIALLENKNLYIKMDETDRYKIKITNKSNNQSISIPFGYSKTSFDKSGIDEYDIVELDQLIRIYNKETGSSFGKIKAKKRSLKKSKRHNKRE